MKSFKISSVLLLLVASFFLVSCDDEPLDGDYYDADLGEDINITARIDGELFEASADGTYAFPGFDDYNLDVGTFMGGALAPIGNPMDLVSHGIDFLIRPFDGEGTYEYDETTAEHPQAPILNYSYTEFMTGHILKYNAREATVTFTEFDEVNRVASGTFEGVLKIVLFDEDNYSASDFPDIHITNGRFTNMPIMRLGDDDGSVGF